MSTWISSKLNIVLLGKMVVTGIVVGFLLFSAYAIPMPEEKAGTVDKGYFAFQASCTTCHSVDTVQNYRGSSSWSEIVELMKGYGAFINDVEVEEITDYLENTYPR